MLELDLLLNAFIQQCLDELTDAQIQAFETMLTYPDPDIYAWLMGYESPANKELAQIVVFIRSYDKH